jgi:carboxymethylenebutenolidase
MDQRIVELYDEYTHRPLDRRVFMERLIALVGSAGAAEAALAALAPNYAKAAILPEGDPRIETSRFDATQSGIKGYVASQKGTHPDGAKAVVIVVHENRGLNPHIEDIARRLAAEGFTAYAPDLLVPFGGTPRDDDDKARDLFAKVDVNAAADSVAKLVANLKARPSQPKVAVIGFCWGGGLVNLVATKAAGLDAGVAYYGVAPPLADVPKVKARMLMHYAGLDQRVNATMPGYDEALKKAGVAHEMFVYEGANHAFNNDTSTDRYNEAAAKLAWGRTIAFLKASLTA